ncbi:MAG: helix-turn-helix transcriptional regulator [Terriglobia bacterium]
MRLFFNTKDAAAFLSLSPYALNLWRVNGHRNGPAFYKLHGHAVRYSRLDLESWLHARRMEVLSG